MYAALIMERTLDDEVSLLPVVRRPGRKRNTTGALERQPTSGNEAPPTSSHPRSRRRGTTGTPTPRRHKQSKTARPKPSEGRTPRRQSQNRRADATQPGTVT
eukprot:GHVU01178836.1.p1 GENE.GHVU01178836.1~~GHVU01178836.1.p1  ORF type:complete len:102 (+),score=4.85 GHVU01178836.1:469-774(+)